jgi:hypothetical protein
MDLKPEELIRGDLIEVHWSDICEEPTGDPDEAEVYPRVSVGYFWARKASKRGMPVLVTTTTIDKDEETSQSGWCAYPESVITRIKSIRKKRRPRKKKEGNE